MGFHNPVHSHPGPAEASEPAARRARLGQNNEPTPDKRAKSACQLPQQILPSADLDGRREMYLTGHGANGVEFPAAQPGSPGWLPGSWLPTNTC